MNPLNQPISRVANFTPYNEFATLVGVYRLLGVALSVNLNSLNLDTPIPLQLVPGVAAGSAFYKIQAVTVDNASTSLTTAQVALYTAPAAGGTNLAAAQALSTLVASTNDIALTLATGATQSVQTANTLYVRNTTAQGTAATADVYVWGWVYP